MVGDGRHGGIAVVLERDHGAPPPSSVAGDEQLGFGIVDAIDDRLGEKPPKITEWGAPMRAQASIAMASSGTMPM